MTKFSQPAWRSLIAMHRPANPDPTIATSYPAFSSAAIAAKVTGQSGPVSVLFRIGFQPMQDLPGVRDDEGVRIVLVLRQVEPRRIQVPELRAADDIFRDARRQRDV